MTVGLLLAAVVALPSAAPLPSITIGGALVHAGAVVDAATWNRLPHTTTSAAGHDGKLGAYDGIRLADVVHDAGAPVGDAVRGSSARAYLVVSASDGYTAIFTLAELETSELRCAPVLADARDGAPLSGDVGPLSIVAPCDRSHARWVRGVIKLTVVVTTGS